MPCHSTRAPEGDHPSRPHAIEHRRDGGHYHNGLAAFRISSKRGSSASPDQQGSIRTRRGVPLIMAFGPVISVRKISSASSRAPSWAQTRPTSIPPGSANFYRTFSKTVAMAVQTVLQEAAEIVEKLAGNAPRRSSATSCKI